MKHCWIVVLFCCSSVFSTVEAQKLSLEDRAALSAIEDTIIWFSDSALHGMDLDSRMAPAYGVIRKLLTGLNRPYSFEYKFARQEYVSEVYPEDSTFRIFSWHLKLNNETYRHFGAIQFRSFDGSLDLVPLLDASIYLPDSSIRDTVLSDTSWFGATYYDIVTKEVENKKYYFLFGYDAHHIISAKKLIDVLTYDIDGVYFGAPMFQYDTSRVPTIHNRFVMEFNKEGSVICHYSDVYEKIVYNHTAPLDVKMSGVHSFDLPDGKYHALIWDEKIHKWRFQDKAFDFHVSEAPIESGAEKEMQLGPR